MTVINRRKFVAAAAGTAVTAAAAGVAGEMLIGKRFRNVVPAVQAAPPAVKVTPPRIVKQKPLPVEDSLNIAGLSPFYTPNGQFYRVDTSLTIPQVSAAVLRSTPSSTSASASIRRAAALFFSPLAALRSSEAVRSSRVTDTAAPMMPLLSKASIESEFC